MRAIAVVLLSVALCLGVRADEEEFGYRPVDDALTVRALDDATFEHLTQAATGATTGDWLVAFVDGGSRAPSRALLEKAQELAPRTNMAVVDCDSSAGLKRRFRITEFPTILFFSRGKVHKLPHHSAIKPRDVHTFVDGGYSAHPSLRVPDVNGELSGDFGGGETTAKQTKAQAEKGSWGSIALGVLGALAFFGFVILRQSKPNVKKH